MYPSLVNCTTIDLFADWPHDALIEVGERYLSQIELAGDDKVNHFFQDRFILSNISQ
jgi:dynein heavy chain